MAQCPFCKDIIQDGAVKCRYCSSWLLPSKIPTDEKNDSLKPGPDQVQYIVDKGLLRFGKFIIGGLAFFIAAGAFVWGFNIKEASDQASKAVTEARIARDSIKYYQEIEKNTEKQEIINANRFEAQIKHLMDTIYQFRDSAKKAKNDAINYKTSIILGKPTKQTLDSNNAPITGPAFTAPQVAKLYNFP